MADTLHLLVERYGLIAVFAGCLGEGESAAILAGFFAHQKVFVAWQAFAVVASGAFLGDTGLYLLGRRFAERPFVQRQRARPAFARAEQLIRRHPRSFVFFNRYMYGIRAIGGVAAGLSGVPVAVFLVLNALSSLVWATIFLSAGYVFGLGVERIVGDALLKHERLIIGLGVVIVVAVAAALLARHLARRYSRG
jgi:membrane protein DedA with SNARE-associated domain